MDDVTAAIAKYVKEKGFQVSVISEKIGVSDNSLYNSFSGHRKLRADEFLKLCDFFGKNPGDFRNCSAEV